MSLNDFYKLRRDFIVIGLTGRMQGGADKFTETLNKENKAEVLSHLNDAFIKDYSFLSDSESRKLRRIKDFFGHDPNWIEFEKLEYKNVILLFILQNCYDADPDKYVENLCSWIIELGSYKPFKTARFGNEIGLGKDSSDFINNDFKKKIKTKIESISSLSLNRGSLSDYLDNCSTNFFFGNDFIEFADFFFEALDEFSIYLRHKLIHTASFCLRRFGTLKIEVIKSGEESKNHDSLKDIYIIAKVINRLIKLHRDKNDKKAHIIIDRLKNSYEIMYFRERYSGFYLIAANRDDDERKADIKDKVRLKSSFTDKTENYNRIVELDNIEYKTNEFKKGIFDSFDIENCVQKADYHLWYKEELNCCDLSKYKEAGGQVENKCLSKTNEYYVYLPFEFQILKLIALIQQPGLITPNYIERTMQVAYNAKLNSGCISRQVGAVVTDSSFSVKGIGWNDVPNGQTPCSLRDLRDFENKENKDLPEFTAYEKGDTEFKYEDEKKFNEKLKEDIKKYPISEDLLEGRSCSYCFKTFHNTYESKENQVHTRSLHAEENAMMQISKNGGQGLYGGNLFTTASPCELCAKKAYQLGLKNIFYIDRYPGISRNHILEGGKSKTNPNLYQFQGAIGRGFNKLYEPFMSIKDETTLRTSIQPSSSPEAMNKQFLTILKESLKKSEYKELKGYLENTKEDLISQTLSILNEKYKRPNDETPN